jgi:peptide chain release factor
MNKKICIITSGRGPVECSRVVAKVQELMMKHARKNEFTISVLDSVKGELKGTLLSATLLLEGDKLKDFVAEWEGTVQWISKSPYRAFNKRKNWFVGVSFFDVNDELKFNIRDVEITTSRSGGPGGQSVNKVESAVSAKHIPTGVQVKATDTRSQLENKQLAIERLQEKVLSIQTQKLIETQQVQWQEHNCLERGNPIKTINIKLI